MWRAERQGEGKDIFSAAADVWRGRGVESTSFAKQSPVLFSSLFKRSRSALFSFWFARVMRGALPA